MSATSAMLARFSTDIDSVMAVRVAVRRVLALDDGQADRRGGPDRVQVGAEFRLGDVQAVDIHRQDPLAAEDEQHQGRIGAAGEAEPICACPASRPDAVAEQALFFRVGHQFQRGKLRRDAELLGDGVAVVQLVGGIEPDLETDGLLLRR